MATTIVNNFVGESTPLELIIKTDNLSGGSTPSTQFRLPHNPSASFNYVVDWGDDTTQEVKGFGSGGSPTHEYTEAGTYHIKIWGLFGGFAFNETGDRLKLLSIVSQGRQNRFTHMVEAFYGCNNLDSFPWTNTSALTQLIRTWRRTKIPVVPLIDISNVDGVSSHFETWMECSELVEFPPLNLVPGNRFTRCWHDCTKLKHFPPNMFDDWSGVPVLTCFFGTWFNCPLTSQSVENILVSIDTSGKSAPAGATGTQADITIDYDTSTGSLSSATNTAITNLKTKGWHPHINGTYV